MYLADDFRLHSNKSTSILGLAVMPEIDDIGRSMKNCQLVVLDTLVNKTEQFVERCSLHVSFDERLWGCALISEKEALVFTSYEMILVCLVS